MGEDFESVVLHRERAKEEAAKLYREDHLIRQICDSVVSEALESLEFVEPKVTADAITKAVMTAIALVASNRPDVSFVMRERDHLRDQMLARTNLFPGIPIHPTNLGPDLDRSMLVDRDEGEA